MIPVGHRVMCAERVGPCSEVVAGAAATWEGYRDFTCVVGIARYYGRGYAPNLEALSEPHCEPASHHVENRIVSVDDFHAEMLSKTEKKDIMRWVTAELRTTS